MPDKDTPMSLEEFYDAMEQDVVTTTPTTVMSPHRNMISYYDINRKYLVNIDLQDKCKLPYKTPVYAYLSTEPNKVKFGEILLESFPKNIEMKVYSTKYSPTIDIHVLYISTRAKKAVNKLIETIVNTIARWSDAQYYPVATVDAFGKYMTEEIDKAKQIVHKHKCVLLKTKSYLLPTGTMSTAGLPVIWSFDGSYIDPKTRDTVFTYTIDAAYQTDPKRKGLILDENTVLNRYAATMNDIIGIINDPDSSTLLLFESNELYKFVKKEVTVLFEDLKLQPISVIH